MLINLASTSFNLHDWTNAAAAFERIAKRHEKDATAAFNVAVSLDKEGSRCPAAKWYAETLRRNPHYRNRETIIAARIEQLCAKY